MTEQKKNTPSGVRMSPRTHLSPSFSPWNICRIQQRWLAILDSPHVQALLDLSTTRAWKQPSTIQFIKAMGYCGSDPLAAADQAQGQDREKIQRFFGRTQDGGADGLCGVIANMRFSLQFTTCAKSQDILH